MNFANLFATLVESESAAASRAFGSIASHRGRIDALHDAAEVYFSNRPDAERFAQYKKLVKLSSKASARRNEIAHGLSEKYADSGHHGGGWYLVPAQYNTKKNKLLVFFDSDRGPHTFTTAKYALAPNQIREFSNGFHTLSQSIANFGRQLRKAQQNPAPSD